MAIELRLQLKMSQQLVMTPQLQQAIKLLQLNRLELVNVVQQELTENPVLEEVEGEEDPTPGEIADMTPGEERSEAEASSDPQTDDPLAADTALHRGTACTPALRLLLGAACAPLLPLPLPTLLL